MTYILIEWSYFWNCIHWYSDIGCNWGGIAYIEVSIKTSPFELQSLTNFLEHNIFKLLFFGCLLSCLPYSCPLIILLFSCLNYKLYYTVFDKKKICIFHPTIFIAFQVKCFHLKQVDWTVLKKKPCFRHLHSEKKSEVTSEVWSTHRWCYTQTVDKEAAA